MVRQVNFNICRAIITIERQAFKEHANTSMRITSIALSTLLYHYCHASSRTIGKRTSGELIIVAGKFLGFQSLCRIRNSLACSIFQASASQHRLARQWLSIWSCV